MTPLTEVPEQCSPDLGGIRLPHAWSIVDEPDLARWLMACHRLWTSRLWSNKQRHSPI
jgi:hypothetical protein